MDAYGGVVLSSERGTGTWALGTAIGIGSDEALGVGSELGAPLCAPNAYSEVVLL